MNDTLENMEEILSQAVSGFHIYSLDAPVRLCFASDNLCQMLRCNIQQLLSDSEDLYVRFVHPADTAAYTDFIRNLSSKEQTLTLQYRIIKVDGTVCHVTDTVTSKKLSGGSLRGYSVLTDITELKTENLNLQFLNETIPCGFLKYTCEKQPKVTYINDQMLKFLRFPEVKDGEVDYLELYRDNIFLMIPMEERSRFSRYLDRVYTQGVPLAGEMTVLRCDGTKAYMFGWVTKCINENGVEEFQSACMDITERYSLKKEQETKRYLKALTDVYDMIFEYNLRDQTVKCLYGQNSPFFRQLENISMDMHDATDKWITNTVCERDRSHVQGFFNDFYEGKLSDADSHPRQITYSALSSAGEQRVYTGIFLKLDGESSLFCCRKAAETREVSSLRDENESLKNMQELVMRFTDGIAAFEIRNEFVTPLYSSDNVCEFFGFTKDQWLPMMKKSTPIRDFVSKSKTSYESFAKLLENGEAEFTYFDLKSNAERRIKAICSQKSSDGTSSRYVMLYNISGDTEDTTQNSRVYIRTFGYFDVFVDDKPIAFRNEKSKELLALLVDRRGGYVSSEEAISFLWENENANSVTLARYRKVALRLKNILEEYGIASVVESVSGKRRIAVDNVRCDLYDYLTGKEEHSQLFKGSYLTNYSWGETTLGELLGGYTD